MKKLIILFSCLMLFGVGFGQSKKVSNLAEDTDFEALDLFYSIHQGVSSRKMTGATMLIPLADTAAQLRSELADTAAQLRSEMSGSGIWQRSSGDITPIVASDQLAIGGSPISTHDLSIYGTSYFTGNVFTNSAAGVGLGTATAPWISGLHAGGYVGSTLGLKSNYRYPYANILYKIGWDGSYEMHLSDVYNDVTLSDLVAGSSWTLSGSNLYPSSVSYNVGIGTNDPDGHKLNVNGTSYFSNTINSIAGIDFGASADGSIGDNGLLDLAFSSTALGSTKTLSQLWNGNRDSLSIDTIYFGTTGNYAFSSGSTIKFDSPTLPGTLDMQLSSIPSWLYDNSGFRYYQDSMTLDINNITVLRGRPDTVDVRKNLNIEKPYIKWNGTLYQESDFTSGADSTADVYTANDSLIIGASGVIKLNKYAGGAAGNIIPVINRLTGEIDDTLGIETVASEGIMHVATKTYSSAELLAGGNDTILHAQGARIAIIPIKYMWYYEYGSIAYTGTDDQTELWTKDIEGNDNIIHNISTNLIYGSNDNLEFISAGNYAVTTTTLQDLYGINVPFWTVLNSASSGNGTLTFKMWYYEVDLN